MRDNGWEVKLYGQEKQSFELQGICVLILKVEKGYCGKLKWEVVFLFLFLFFKKTWKRGS